jgi:hypothetical protein
VNNTLRQALRKTRELRHQVENLLLGDEGDLYEAELKKFVSKRPCWIPEESRKNEPAELPKTRMAPLPKFELYLHDKQKNGGWMKGYDLEKHLQETNLLNRAFSLEDDIVKGWLANPKTYPEEFKGKAIFLWKSRQDSDDYRSVAYLIWSGEQVIVLWHWLEFGWRGLDPALLARSSAL